MDEPPCKECGVCTRADVLEDLSELVPFGGLTCPDCAARVVSDLHDDPECTCSCCEREWQRMERRLAEQTALARGGFGSMRVLLGVRLEVDQ